MEFRVFTNSSSVSVKSYSIFRFYISVLSVTSVAKWFQFSSNPPMRKKLRPLGSNPSELTEIIQSFFFLRQKNAYRTNQRLLCASTSLPDTGDHPPFPAAGEKALMSVYKVMLVKCKETDFASAPNFSGRL